MSDQSLRSLFVMTCVTVMAAAAINVMRPVPAQASPSVAPRCEVFQAAAFVTEAKLEATMAEMLSEGRTQFVSLAAGSLPVICAW